jgi:hypothetical protein
MGLKMGIRLVVKGPPAVAQRAAARHGVPARCFSENPFKEKRRTRNDSYCDAPCSSYTKLTEWLAAPHGRKLKYRPSLQHPEGALLFFSMKGCPGGALSGARRRRRRRR